MELKTTKSYFFIAASVALLAFTGCSKKSEAPKETANVEAPAGGGMPEGHPGMGADKTAENITKMAHTTIKTQKEVKLSDEVKAKWKEVNLDITDAASKNKENITVKVGETIKLNNQFKLKVETFVPDYAIAENRIESRSNEPKNPAVLIELLDGDKSVARGWVFKDFPEFNSYTDDRFPIALVGPSVKTAAPAPAAQK